jgi:uncharacterized membrane protein
MAGEIPDADQGNLRVLNADQPGPIATLEPSTSESTLDLDLTADDTRPAMPTVLHPKPYSIARAREEVRSIIAKRLIWLLSFTVAAAFILFYIKDAHSDLKDLLIVVFPPLIAIIGTVLGFYFGTEVSDTSKKE